MVPVTIRSWPLDPNMSVDVEPPLETVLVVDDDALVCSSMTRALRRLGYEVLQAENGEDGLEKAARLRPAVVFLDLRMPGMDGHTVLRRLQATASPPRVVVMSGDGDMDDVVDVMRAGAVDYLRKPWSAADLLGAVTRAVDTTYGRDEQKPQVAALPEERPSADAAPLSPRERFSAILERVRAGEMRLPSIPSVLTDLRQMMLDKTSSISDLVRRIQRDPQLAAQVLRVSNSAYYARNGRNHDLQTAVSRIGLRQTYTLVETIIAAGLWEAPPGEARVLLDAVWKRSLVQALAARAVTQMVAVRGELSPDTAYLIGLFAELGASFLGWMAAECRLDIAGDDGIHSAIHQHHAAIGGLIAHRWKLDASIVAAVRAHHATTPGPGANPYGPIMIVAAGITDGMVGGDVTAAAPRDRAFVASRMADLGISDVLRLQLSETVKQELAAVSSGG